MSDWIIDVDGRTLRVHGPYRKDGRIHALSIVENREWAKELGAELCSPKELDAIWYTADYQVPLKARDPVKAPFDSLQDDADAMNACGKIAAGKGWTKHGKTYGAHVPEGMHHIATHGVNKGKMVSTSEGTEGIKLSLDASGKGYVIQPHSGFHASEPSYLDYSQLGYAVEVIDAHERPTRETPPAPSKWNQRGDGVKAWQTFLERNGYKPGPIDGWHYTQTEAATVAWFRDRGIERVAEVAIKEEHDTEPKHPILSMRLPHIVFEQAHDYQKGRPFGPPIWVFVHTAECKETRTAAENLRDWAEGDINASWHFAVDVDSITQSVLVTDRAWAMGSNNGHHLGIHIEFAGNARQSEAEWSDDYSVRMLDLGALLIAHLCNDNSIPAMRRDYLGLRARIPGLAGHEDATKAWPKTTTHQDPGRYFPWTRLIDNVNMNLALLL